jgi:hypothetical protein
MVVLRCGGKGEKWTPETDYEHSWLDLSHLPPFATPRNTLFAHVLGWCMPLLDVVIPMFLSYIIVQVSPPGVWTAACLIFGEDDAKPRVHMSLMAECVLMTVIAVAVKSCNESLT